MEKNCAMTISGFGSNAADSDGAVAPVDSAGLPDYPFEAGGLLVQVYRLVYV